MTVADTPLPALPGGVHSARAVQRHPLGTWCCWGARVGPAGAKGGRRVSAAHRGPCVLPLAAVLVGLLAACATADTDGGRRQVADGTAQVGGDIISTVNGEAITLAQVRALSASTQLAPREVLRRLQAHLLLVREAEGLGIQVDSDSEYKIRQALVQALLARAVEAVPVADSAVREAYEAEGDRFRPPPKRSSIHVLARVKASASAEVRMRARALALRAAEVLRGGDPVEAIQEAVREWSDETLEVKVEALPAVPEDGPFDPAFSTALFELERVGQVRAPVETRFGFHAIRLSEIVETPATPFEAVYDTLHSELQLRQRVRTTRELLDGISRGLSVKRQEDAMRLLGQIAL